jgi:hypothetical protein
MTTYMVPSPSRLALPPVQNGTRDAERHVSVAASLLGRWGERPADLDQKLGFVSALYRLAARDPDVHRILVLVRYLARPSSALNERTLRERVLAEIQRAGPQAEVELARVAA